jgi:hypothetical protein
VGAIRGFGEPAAALRTILIASGCGSREANWYPHPLGNVFVTGESSRLRDMFHR